MSRFDRTYRLLVGKDSAATEIIPPIRVTFDLKKDLSEQTNHHTVRAWNLAKSTVHAMQKPDTRVVLYAGYEQENGAILIATGDLVYAYQYRQGPDIITKIDFLDGRISVRDTVISVGYGKGVKASEVIQDIAKQMGLVLVMDEQAPDRTWEHGYSYYGSAYVALHKITRATGLQWSIQNSDLYVIKEGGTTPNTAFILNDTSGLLGSPKRLRQGAQDKAVVEDAETGDQEIILQQRQEQDGWQVESLLLPTLLPGDKVKLESKAVTGWFKARAVQHRGDSAGIGDWKTIAQVVRNNEPD